MAMYYRSKATSGHVLVNHTEVFKNTSPKDSHTRMLTFNLGIQEESYIVLDRVKVMHMCGTKNLTKVYIGDIDEKTCDIMRAFHSCVSSMYPDMSIDPFDSRSLKLVLKKKWYRAYDANGAEINPSDLVLDKMSSNSDKGSSYKKMSFQIHVNVIRTHKNQILFQPMIRKVYLHE